MTGSATDSAQQVRLDDVDRQIVAALQCDGRASAEQLGAALGLSPATIRRRLGPLLHGGGVQVRAVAARPDPQQAALLRIRVLRGKLEPITAALARRPDIPFVDVSAGGDEILAVLLATGDAGNRLVFRQLPASTAITSVEVATILHVFSQAHDWRLAELSDRQRRLLTPPSAGSAEPVTDPTDRALVEALAVDARATAAAVAASTGYSESTVRRRLGALLAQRSVVTQVVLDPELLGLTVDANLWMQVPPERLDAVGQALARHPAVHGAVATTGAANLHIAVWLRDLEYLYRFITVELAGLGLDAVETVLVGRAVKRPGVAAARL
jgi:DNA-binding Lrp family transcriptional regulator